MKSKLTRRTFVTAGSATIAGLALGLAGCGGSEGEEKTDDVEGTENADAGADDAGEKTDSNLSGSVTAVGSSALQPLAEAAAQEFNKEHPDVDVTVQGGGSGTGITSIAEGSVDIGNSDVFAEEKDVSPDGLTDNKVCIVGMGPVVNPGVTVDDISKDDLKKIFMGEITNWSEVGGDDLDIVVINRAEGSGTRATFETFALDGESAMQAQEQDNSGTVRSMVESTEGAISYLAFSYYADSIKALSVDGVAAEAENIYDNSWVIWAYEHMYTSDNPTEQTQAFVDFMFTDEVQKNLVPELGYIPVTEMKVERDVDGNVTNL